MLWKYINQLYGVCISVLQSVPTSLEWHSISVSFSKRPHLTGALPPLYLLPTESHNVLLLQWPAVPDSMLFFHPSQTVKPLASCLPGAADESFIKATVSCVAHLFSQPSQALRALPNCLRMDDLSGSRGNRNIPIHHQEPMTYTYTHAKNTNGDIQYTQREHIH